MTKLAMPVADRDHALGSVSAPVTLVEYGDYECPYCGAAHPVVQRLLKRLGDDVRFIFRNFPLRSVHPHAEHAAWAAEAAGAQGRFWEMHDWLFEHQRSLDDDELIRAAGALGLDLEDFSLQVDSEAIRDRVQEDFGSGLHSGVNGTPTFFINGVRFDRAPGYEELLEALEAEIPGS
jgi:protein-disulfide isomerase